jgi:hypothetical protein
MSNQSSQPPLAFFEILSEIQYPILRALLPFFNQYDLNSLRATCKTLRSRLPPTSPLLGACCQWLCPNQLSSRPILIEGRHGHGSPSLIFSRKECTNGPEYSRPLRPCRSYSLEPTVRVHDDIRWQCEHCLIDAVDRASHILSLPKLPICHSCHSGQTARPNSVTVIPTVRSGTTCSCKGRWAARAIAEGFCIECSIAFFRSEVFPKVEADKERACRNLDWVVKSRNWCICTNCHESSLGPDLDSCDWMCAGCGAAEEVSSDPSPPLYALFDDGGDGDYGV